MGATTTTSAPPTYRGRFAPSPTGPLHFGSLIAAVASFADARAQGGEWLVRIEDLDLVREVPGAARQILATLSAFGLYWDGEVLYQSARTDAYRAALDRLAGLGLAYPCACTRSEVARSGRLGPEGPIYPGTCRQGLPPGRSGRAWRLCTDSTQIRFNDRIQGDQGQVVGEAIGDFVLRRADGLHAYQLAVVVDDAWQGVSQVVRGADLLLSTPRQILLQRALGLPSPQYAHCPLVLYPDGRKLSKSLAACPVDPGTPLPALRRAWALLGQDQIPAATSIRGFWGQALPRWRIEQVPRVLSFPLDPVAAAGGGDCRRRPTAVEPGVTIP